jgi:hypothetical protein
MADQFNNTLVYNSITNKLDDEKRDLNSPFSFLEFLNFADILTKELDELNLYQQYLKEWESITNISLTSINSDIREQFITFLSEVKLKFSTREERRYFDNIDLNDNEQLTIAVPFFTSKIKEISLYFASKRDEVTKNLRYIKTKGSRRGVDVFIKDKLSDLYSGDDVPPELTIPENIGEFLKNIEIETERQYDTFNDYYDLDPGKSPTFYDTVSGNRFDYFTSNTNVISADYFIDTEKTIKNIINEQGIVLSEIPGLLVTYDTTDISSLDKTNFINYINTNNRQDLKYLLDAELIENYMGVDMYYLSSNNTGEYTYDKLFDAKSPYRNLLNVNNPATLSIPGNSFEDERSIGLFFTPSKRGILRMEADFTATLLPDEIEPDTTYIFPDPDRYGKVSGVGASARVNPFLFSLKNTEFKNYSSSFGKSSVESSNIDQNFYAYSSLEQQNFNYNNTNPLRSLESINLSGSLVKEVGDIFGNQYLIFNKTDFPNRQLNNFSVSESPLSLNNTKIAGLAVDEEKETISGIKDKLKPIYVSNIVKNTIEPISVEFDAVFSRYKYNQTLYAELSSSIFVDLNIFKNVFFIKTQNNLIIDNIEYTTTGEFRPAGFVSRVKDYNSNINTNQNQIQISNISNPARIENDIFYIKIASDPTVTSPINLRFFEFSIFKYDIDKRREVNLVTAQTQNESFFNDNFTFDVGSNIVQVKDIKLNYNSKQNLLFCLTDFADLNNASFFHVLVFKIIGNDLSIIQNFIINPSNFTVTQNFYNSSVLANNFLTQSISSTPIQNNNYGTLTF